MSETQTGATAEQIERAAERLFNFRMTGDANASHQTGNEPTWKIVSRRRYVTPIHEVVDFIVTADERIVTVADLQWLLQIAVSVGLDADGQLSRNGELIDRIRAAIGDGA